VNGIVVVGDVMVDVVARLSGPVAVGSDSEASISFGGGGSAANVAAWLAHAGATAVLVGRVGDDARGASAAAALRASGVDARLAVDDSLPTGTCIVLVAPGGERSMLPDAGANSALAPADLPDSLLAPGGHLHLTGYSLVRPGPRPAALGAISRAAAAGMSVSVDPSSAALLGPEFLELAAGATLLLPNLAEARTLSGEGDAQTAARALASRFPEVVVKLGAEGALWTNGSDVELVPAAPAAALDTTGAGDAFAAGLLAARLRGAPPAEALAAGCALASQAVVTPGARPPRRARA
jgi:sugar/nucleoside kinase (ribokinase family)